MNETIEDLGEQIYVLEDENDRMKEESDRLREDEAAERERLEALSAALKEVLSSYCAPSSPFILTSFPRNSLR